MSQYYYVGISLPNLSLDRSPDISFEDFTALLQFNLSEEDYQLVQSLRRYYDVENIRSSWKKEAFNPYGNLNEKELEETLLRKEGLPSYLANFFETYQEPSVQLKNFPNLLASYYREEAKLSADFLKEFLDWERKIRLLQTAFRAKRLGREFEEELIYENLEEEFIQQLLVQKDTPHFAFPEEFCGLGTILEKYYDQPLFLHKALIELRFNQAKQLAGTEPFSMNRILAATIQFILVEQWQKLINKKNLNPVVHFIEEPA